MPPSKPFLMLALAVLALAAAAALVWQVTSLLRPKRRVDDTRTTWTATGVVTHADYLAAGERNVRSWLEQNSAQSTGISTATAEAAERAVVRVRVSYDFREDKFSTESATGALVHHGQYVATVAHGIEPALRRPDARIQIVLGDGRLLGGVPQTLQHYDVQDAATDWCLIKIDDPPADAESFELGDPAAGERLVLGFPGRYGRDAADHVALDDPPKALPLRPLRIVCRTRDDDPAHLELLAGCVPLGGISGAPCVDARGRLVSIERAFVETQKEGVLVVTLNVVPLAGIRSALQASPAVK